MKKKNLWNFNLTFSLRLNFESFMELKTIFLFNCSALLLATTRDYTEIVKLLLLQPGIKANCKTISILILFS